MYDRLVAYRAAHGDCLVPGRHARLGPWVQIQRAQYRLYQRGQNSALTADKVGRLDSLGFAWRIVKDRDESWADMYGQLVEYRERNGGRTNVPADSRTHPKLGSWCKRQRKTYRDLRDGRSTVMKAEWVEKLREIGFDLDGPGRGGATSGGGGRRTAAAAPANAMAEDHPADDDNNNDDNGSEGEDGGGASSKPAASSAKTAKLRDDDATFRLRLEEVRQFVASEGHGLVPESYPPNEALGRWASQKRKQKRKADEGRPTRLTPDRIRRLEEAGFAWLVWGNRTEKWDEMYQKLVRYREEFGTTRVVHSARSSDPEHRRLGMWCDRQKATYKLRQRGKNSPMTEERAKRLDDIG